MLLTGNDAEPATGPNVLSRAQLLAPFRVSGPVPGPGRWGWPCLGRPCCRDGQGYSAKHLIYTWFTPELRLSYTRPQQKLPVQGYPRLVRTL